MASAKVNDRGSFGSKRSRNDVPKKDGDWTCPKCGNVNFSFRTVCNRGKCGTARPSASPQRMGSVTLPYTYGHAPPVYFGGAEVRPAVPFGMPSGYGPPLSHPGMRYDYGLHGGAAGPYAVLSPFPPPGPTINGYGIGFRGSPLPVLGSWFEEGLSDNNSSRKRRGGPDGVSEGDWVCPKCDNVNFSFRTTCNMKKCGTPRPTPGVKKSTSNNNDAGAPEGSWTCTECGNLNYPFRTECNRKGCGKEKPSS